MSTKSKSSTASDSKSSDRQVSLDASNNDGYAVASGGDTSINIRSTDYGAIDKAVTAVTAANNNMAGVVLESYDFAEEVGGAAFGVVGQANNNMAGVTREANKNMATFGTAANNNMAGVTREANKNMATLATAANNNMAGVVLESYDYAQEVNTNSFDFAESIFSQTLGSLEKDNAAQYAQQAGVLAGVASSARSETSQAMDKITTYFFAAVVVVGGLYAIRG